MANSGNYSGRSYCGGHDGGMKFVEQGYKSYIQQYYNTILYNTIGNNIVNIFISSISSTLCNISYIIISNIGQLPMCLYGCGRLGTEPGSRHIALNTYYFLLIVVSYIS